MDQPAPSKHTGRKIWYGFVIALSILVLVTSVAGVIGSWALQSTLSDATVSLLQAAENAAGRARSVIDQVEEPLAEIETIAANVAEVSAKLSQNVTDEGLLKLLLPPEQAEKLTGLATKVQDTLATVHEVISGAVGLYQAIDKMPFISLPSPGLDKVREVEQAVADIRLGVEELKGKVAEIRAGAAEKIGAVSEIADRIATSLSGVQTRLAELDSDLAGFQELAASLRAVVPTVFALGALLVSLFFIFVGYTQVEIIRLFRNRWRMLSPARQVVSPPNDVGQAVSLPEDPQTDSLPNDEPPASPPEDPQTNSLRYSEPAPEEPESDEGEQPSAVQG